jgi:hypothetical protein
MPPVETGMGGIQTQHESTKSHRYQDWKATGCEFRHASMGQSHSSTMAAALSFHFTWMPQVDAMTMIACVLPP